MKPRCALFSALVALLPLHDSHAVAVGDTRFTVIAELGPMQGAVSLRDAEMLYFPRGEVRLVNDRVVSATVITEQQLRELEAREAAEKHRLDAIRAEREARLREQGLALREKRRSDSAFLALPAREQLRLWQAFELRHPMLSADTEITRLAGKIADEDAAARALDESARRLEALEARVVSAEQRAARAERTANRSRPSLWAAIFWPASRGRDFDSPHDRDRDKHADRTDRESPASRRGESTDAARGHAMGSFDAARNAVYSNTRP